MNRAERRTRTGLVIKRRERLLRTFSPWVEPAVDQTPTGHRLHKRDPMGACNHRGCSICALERNDKREARRRERHEGKRDVA